jgi:hypothetical protein
MKRFSLESLERTSWFGPLVQQVQQELDRLAAGHEDHRPALEKELRDLEDQVRGLSQSLAKPDLPPAVRFTIESDLEKLLRRQQEVEHRLAEVNALRQQARAVLDPQPVVDRLNRLDDVLAQNNPTRGNLELSLHIDHVRCYQDGQVVVRTCKLGALAGAVELVGGAKAPEVESPAGLSQGQAATPRRRARLRIDSADEDLKELREAAVTAADVHRFAGLGPEWFWEDAFQLPRKTCWSEEHAAAVAAKKQETGSSLARLAEQFGRSIPTIRRALQLAQEQEVQGKKGEKPPA